MKEQKYRFVFENRQIILNTRFGVFVTMNPQFIGRVELPDNLKSLLRPVSMNLPDYDLIAENIFMSSGNLNLIVFNLRI